MNPDFTVVGGQGHISVKMKGSGASCVARAQDLNKLTSMASWSPREDVMPFPQVTVAQLRSWRAGLALAWAGLPSPCHCLQNVPPGKLLGEVFGSVEFSSVPLSSLSFVFSLSQHQGLFQ